MELVDTHAHLDTPDFSGDLLQVLQRAAEAGVGRIVCVGTTLESSRRCVELARRFPGRLYAAVGIHPGECAQARPEDMEQIERLASLPQVVAVGETGMDLRRSPAPAELQEHYFRAHVRLALRLGKPLIIHSRKADGAVVAVLREHAGEVRGVRHCFDGTPRSADAYLELGLHLGFGGLLTRQGYRRTKEAARLAPANRLLLETDCPYLTPAEAAAGRNEPAFIVHSARALAGLREVGLEQVAETTRRNAEALFFA